MGNQTWKKRRAYRRGQFFGRWKLEERVGRGGNGEVWRVSHEDFGAAAIKLLSFADEKSFNRFKIEIDALARLRNVIGVIPLLDRYIPEKFSDATPWLVMPLAENISSYIKVEQPFEAARHLLDLAITIKEVHDQGIWHRDIKPENLLFWRGRIQLSDFGLAKFPGRPALTRDRQDVGPKFNMAPEMRRSAYRADGRMADVFSFAKTLWTILSGQKLGFDGQYVPSSVLGLKYFMPMQYTHSLDLLLQECTDNEPARRPTMREVVRRLEDWIRLSGDFHKRNLQEWVELEKNIFPMGLPQQAVWTDLDAICSIINAFAGVHSLCHMFYPTSGGNDVTGASRAAETGFIALHIGGRPRDILKPKKLTFQSFGCDPQWNYFRLEAACVPSSGIANSIDRTGKAELLTEYEDGFYISRDHWETGDYDGEDLPPYSRPVVRYLRGSFVFFGKRSYYNRSRDTYDARHDDYGEEGFRKMIERAAIGARLEQSVESAYLSNTLA